MEPTASQIAIAMQAVAQIRAEGIDNDVSEAVAELFTTRSDEDLDEIAREHVAVAAKHLVWAAWALRLAHAQATAEPLNEAATLDTADETWVLRVEGEHAFMDNAARALDIAATEAGLINAARRDVYIRLAAACRDARHG